MMNATTGARDRGRKNLSSSIDWESGRARFRSIVTSVQRIVLLLEAKDFDRVLCNKNGENSNIDIQLLSFFNLFLHRILARIIHPLILSYPWTKSFQHKQSEALNGFISYMHNSWYYKQCTRKCWIHLTSKRRLSQVEKYSSCSDVSLFCFTTSKASSCTLSRSY